MTSSDASSNTATASSIASSSKVTVEDNITTVDPSSTSLQVNTISSVDDLDSTSTTSSSKIKDSIKSHLEESRRILLSPSSSDLDSHWKIRVLEKLNETEMLLERDETSKS